MWAQLITWRLKAGKEGELERINELMRAAEQPGSGLVRSTMMRDQKDPYSICSLVVFESEERARAREQDPGRAEQLREARALMAEVFDGAPSFTDFEVVEEHSG